MKIAVLGLYYSSNLGDAIICDCVMNWMRESFPKAHIDLIDIEGKKEFSTQVSMSVKEIKIRQVKSRIEEWLTRHNIDMMCFWNKRDVQLRQKLYDKIAAEHYDIAVFAGGQLFMDWLSMDVSEFVKRFVYVHTPVFFNACGTGKALSRYIRERLKSALLSDVVKFISSRDNVEEINRLYLSSDKHAVKTFDPALWADCVYGKRKKDNIPVGLGVMHCVYIPCDKLEKFWMDVIKELETRGIEWKMFCNGAIEDYNLGLRVLEKMRMPKENKMMKIAVRPEELVDQISEFSSLISFRLHSHIVAASLNIPAVGINWDEKLKFFYGNIGHKERCLPVGCPAQEVVKVLLEACEEGCDRELIQRQRIYARKILLSEINQVIIHE